MKASHTLNRHTRSVGSDSRQPQHIGEILVAKGVITQDQLRIALIEQEKNQERLGKIIIQLGFATDVVIRDVLAGALGFDSIDLSRLLIDEHVVKLIPKEMARRHYLLAVTLDKRENILTVAMADPNNVIAVDQVKALLGGNLRIKVLLAREMELAKAVEQFYGYELSVEGILREIETGEIDYHLNPAIR